MKRRETDQEILLPQLPKEIILYIVRIALPSLFSLKEEEEDEWRVMNDFDELRMVWQCLAKNFALDQLLSLVRRVPKDFIVFVGYEAGIKEYSKVRYLPLIGSDDGIGNLKNIRHLIFEEYNAGQYLRHPSRRMCDFVDLSHLVKIAENLETLSIQTLGLDENPTPMLRLFRNLTSLTIGWYQGIIPGELIHLEKLILYAPSNKNLLEEIATLQRLRYLEIERSEVLFTQEKNLRLLIGLNELILDGAQLMDNTILASLTSLTSLTYFWEEIDTLDPLVLLPLVPNLRYLYLYNTEYKKYCLDRWKDAGVDEQFDQLCIDVMYY